MEQLTRLYRSIVSDLDRVHETLVTMRHVLAEVRQEHESLGAENERLRAEVERLKLR
jgi:regulator of replication initiation timing